MNARSLFIGCFVVVVAFVGCQTITELPGTPSPGPSATPGQLTPIQIPITNLPTPAPTPTPAPAPAPNPTPSSTPPPGGGGGGGGGGQISVRCSPAIPNDDLPCPRNPEPAFVDAVEQAIVKLKRDQPSLFNEYNVLDETAYYNGVFQNLYDAGYCAVPDSNEVAVSTRSNRKYRENYAILSSAKKYRAGVNSHISACQVP
jgi:hypothetical protein